MSEMSLERALALPPVERAQVYETRDTILYALGLGFGADPLDPDDLRHVYEQDLRALPTMALVLAAPPLRSFDLGFNYRRVVHATQSLEVYRSIPPQGSVASVSKVTDLIDRGADKGSVLMIERELFETNSGDKLATMEIGIACRADGGLGGEIRQAPTMPALPDRAPDATAIIPTSLRSAVIYRLSGDYNPLHVDPAAARAGGFDRPILHGLATFGLAARGITTALDGSMEHIRRLEGRFSAPVFPGETLRADVWQSGHNIQLQLVTVDREAIVFANGSATLDPAEL